MPRMNIKTANLHLNKGARKLKGASSGSTNARKLKGEEKMPQMNENFKFTVKEGCAKIKGAGNLWVREN